MATYLDFDGFRDLSVMPSGFIDDVESVTPGWVEKQLEYWGRWIDSRLHKRYSIPFAAFNDSPPTPAVVQEWLTRLVTVRVWLKRGVDPNDLQFEVVKEDSDNAKTEITEASESVEGLFDLPLIPTSNASGIARGGPLGRSEQSPYVSTDLQRATARNEDSNGSYSGD